MTDEAYRINASAHLRAVIFTTDISFTGLLEILRNRPLTEVLAIVVPRNRRNAAKIEKIIHFCTSRSFLVLEQPYSSNIEAFNGELKKLNPNIGVSWSYSQILPSSTLKIFEYGIWNMHGGKIPEYRGANVLQWAIAQGERQIFATWHLMAPEVDAGPVLSSTSIEIHPLESALSVRSRLFSEGIASFEKIFKDLDRGILIKDFQGASSPPYRPRKYQDGQINKEFTKVQVLNLLRAQCAPWPAPFIQTPEGALPVVGIKGVFDGGFDFNKTKCLTFQFADGNLELIIGNEATYLEAGEK